MERPPTIDEFIDIYNMEIELLRKVKKVKNTKCKACGSDYPILLMNLTEDHCHYCAIEKFYDDVTYSVRDILQSNGDRAWNTLIANRSLTARQRHGKKHTCGS